MYCGETHPISEKFVQTVAGGPRANQHRFNSRADAYLCSTSLCIADRRLSGRDAPVTGCS